LQKGTFSDFGTVSMAQVHSVNCLGLPRDSGCVSVAEQASAGSETESCPQSQPAALSGVFQLAPFKIREYFEGRALLRTTPCSMNEVTGLSCPDLCNPLALPHHGLHSPSLLAYPHTTFQTIKHAAQAPQVHHVLSVNILSFRKFSFGPCFFQVKTSLHYFYPQLTSYFPHNHTSIHLSSFYDI